MNIEAMKSQTIGVEVEMNNITRENASKVAAEYFGTGRWQDTGFVDGYRTWSAWDAQGRKWKFSRDVSIHGSKALFGADLIYASKGDGAIYKARFFGASQVQAIA